MNWKLIVEYETSMIIMHITLIIIFMSEKVSARGTILPGNTCILMLCVYVPECETVTAFILSQKFKIPFTYLFQ